VPGEVRLVVETGFRRDPCGREPCQQQPACEGHPAPDEVAVRGQPELRRERLHQMAGRHVQDRGRRVEREPPDDVGVEQVAQRARRPRVPHRLGVGSSAAEVGGEPVGDERQTRPRRELVAGPVEHMVEPVDRAAQDVVDDRGPVHRPADEAGGERRVVEVEDPLRKPPAAAERPSCATPGGSSVTAGPAAPCSARSRS
jgi:hypothetical protein